MPPSRIFLRFVLPGICLAVSLFVSLPGVWGAPAAGRDLEAFAGARVRVVWVQDTGEKSDPFATGGALRLMGLDSGDGRGEHVILGQAGNYAKPLITPAGNRVVFSDRIRRRVFVVNWDGTGLRELAAGFAVSVWKDDRDGREWVYYGIDENKDEHCPAVYRVTIDDPGKPQLVWDKTLVSVDGFQVSRDGRTASGNFPWPEGGVAGLPNGGLRILAKGCWPGHAPDGETLFWIFDGAHRNLSLWNLRNNRRWQINLSSAPGIKGHEVYHPKWTNRSGFLVMTGPYKVGWGSNRISGGGREVEILLGRFNAARTAVEAWTPVTRNDRGDFFPDAWIDPGRVAPASPKEREAGTTPVPSPPSARKGAWPSDPRGLVYLWQNRARPNEVADPETDRPAACTAEPRDRAIYGRFFDMETAGGAFVADAAANARLLRQCRGSQAFSLEAVVTPDKGVQGGPARIVTFSSGASARNFTLGQEGNRLVFRLRTSQTNENGTPPDWDLGPLRPGVAHHVVVAFQPGSLTAVVNGKPTLTAGGIRGDLETWSPQFLLFGDEWDGQRNWAGRVEHVALYSRFVPPAEAARNYALLKKTLDRRKPLRRLVVDARLSEPSAIPDPKDIAPYRRGLIAQIYEIVKVHSGAYGGKKIMAAHWAILDGAVREEARRSRGTVYRLVLERFADHPELEGERLTMDSDEFRLDLFYEVRP